ncbi:DUF5906 domain-containing protein [Roseomonas sp. E05]|uniref:primase-helicase family protein n=1 Tax=Roseomonas sp. E05 TaxID=3046310 RepID=UPI0024B88F65|nr:primase-helicase family protein [Roseomonas sp. E05]MDJ0390861.1 DUF5906 domain-containing protein [Roseomonas sp. E05]
MTRKSRRARPSCLSRYVYVKGRDQFFDRQTRDFHTLRAVSRAHAHELPEGTNFTQLLLSGPDAVEKADGVTFWPGQPELVEEDGGMRLNLWRQPGLTAREGRVGPFLRHVAHILDDDETAIHFVLNFLAHLVQQPDQKMRFALLIIGSQGTGKSMLADMARELVGKDNTKSLNPSGLVADHNEWVQTAQLVVVHELVGDNSRTAAARLKELITEDMTLVNPKGVSAYQQRNRANFILLSNEDDAAKLDPDDRRYFVWKSQAAKPHSRNYFDRLSAWFKGGGRERVLHYLLTRDLSGFSPFRAPPRTASRADLVAASRHPAHDYLQERLEAGEAPFACDLFTLPDLSDYLAREKQMRLGHRQLGPIMRSLGAVDLGQKRFPEGKRRIWAARHVENWSSKSEDQIVAAFRRPGELAPASSAAAAQPRRRTKLSSF